MAKRIIGTTPKEDGFRMPGEFEAQDQIFMIWPERPDNWRDGAKPVQIAFTNVAKAISRFTPVTMLVSQSQYQNARYQLGSAAYFEQMTGLLTLGVDLLMVYIFLGIKMI